jgi:selenocysteine lyase/cysteine desulfurase
MPMLIESFKQIIEWNPNQIQKYCKKLTQPLNAFFKEIDIHISDEKFQAQHLIGFKLEQKFNVLKLQEDLIKNKIYLSLRGDFLRISPNIYNTQKDIKKLISVLKDNFLK